MEILHVILTLSLLLLVPSSQVESSSLYGTSVSSIARGSSLSTSSGNSPYWLSPSGNFAFGFYQLSSSPDRYIVGIWLVKSSEKTLVWTANPNDLPLRKPSSILFTKEGKLVLRIIPDNKDKLLLPNLPEPASYAKMHDDGNFMLYGSDSQIVWESFDYPTNTILGGQKLRPGMNLISGGHRLSVRETDGFVAIYFGHHRQGYRNDELSKVVSDVIGGSASIQATLNLDTTGNLYLVSSDDVVLKYLHLNKNQQQEERTAKKEAPIHIYRATLAGGDFNLYKERIDGMSTDKGKSASNVVQLWPSPISTEGTGHTIFVCFLIFVYIGVIFIVVIIVVSFPLGIDQQKIRDYILLRQPLRQPSSGDVESGRQ